MRRKSKSINLLTILVLVWSYSVCFGQSAPVISYDIPTKLTQGQPVSFSPTNTGGQVWMGIHDALSVTEHCQYNGVEPLNDVPDFENNVRRIASTITDPEP